MKRRTFLAALLASAAAPATQAWAQPIKKPRVAYIGSAGLDDDYVAAFRQGLAEQGFTIGENIDVEFRAAEGDYSQLPSWFAEFKNRNLDVLVTVGNQAALAAKAAELTTPTVFIVGDDPVNLGLASRYDRPEGNRTGISFYTVDLAAKRLEFLHELLPPGISAAVLINPASPTINAQRSVLQAAARTLGRPLAFVEVSQAADFDGLPEKLREQNVGGFMYNTDPFFNFHRARLVALAKALAMPALYSGREYVAIGGLMSYGSVQPDAYRHGGKYVGQLLKGERAENLPIFRAARFELILNMKSAREAGISFTARQLALADEVIE